MKYAKVTLKENRNSPPTEIPSFTSTLTLTVTSAPSSSFMAPILPYFSLLSPRYSALRRYSFQHHYLFRLRCPFRRHFRQDGRTKHLCP